MSHIGKPSVEQAVSELTGAVLYLGPDGTDKTCGNRCSMHVESGPLKNTCTIHDPKWHVPNLASCGIYKKGPAPRGSHAMPMKPFIAPESSGLIYGKVQCKRCIRANEDATVCLALSKVLEKIYGFEDAEYEIEPDGCCNWNKAEGQTAPRIKFASERSNPHRYA